MKLIKFRNFCLLIKYEFIIILSILLIKVELLLFIEGYVMININKLEFCN